MSFHEVDITGLAHGGYGVCRIGGQVCFVPYALPGDRARVAVERESKGVLWGRVDSLIAPSIHRTDTPCGVFGVCGACTWLHFRYPAQAEWKRRTVADCLERIGAIQIEVGWVEDPERRLEYRTRAEFHREQGRSGFYRLGSREVVDVAACPLCHPRLNAAFERLRRAPIDGSVEIVVNPDGEDVLVWSSPHDTALRDIFPNIQSRANAFPRQSFVFDGVPIVNGTFCQSSLLLNRLLVRCVRERVGPVDRVLDLYCGNGNLSLGLPDECRVVGMDHNRAAVEAAASVGRGEYRIGAEMDFVNLLRREKWDVVVLDPPRTGAKAIGPALAACSADRIVYVSCDPATLARDLRHLAKHGWRVFEVTAIDLFPHTAHIEAVCVLERFSRAER